VFDGLRQQDFFTWSGGHVVYRNVYRKATRGAISLVHCDEELGYSALAQCGVNDGLLLLCQLVVGEKLAYDPVAQRLFDNMLAYCASYVPVRKATAVVMGPGSRPGKLLAESGLKFDPEKELLPTLTAGEHPIVVFDASTVNLKALTAAPGAVKAFTDRGGWLMAWNVTPDGLADFNSLVGVEHVLRPFELERVTPAAVRDPLLSGLTGRDLAMISGEQIFPWSGDKYLVNDEFTYVVDLDDVASFCEFPNARAGDRTAGRAAAAGWPRNMVNGFTSADAWKLIYYMSVAHPSMALKLPREEEITDFSIVLNTHYAKPTKVDLLFDDDPMPVSLTTQPNNERQDFSIPPRKARSLTIKLAEFDNPGVTTGIDNVWIKVKRSEEWYRKVKPLLSLGGLVKYPMGQGGLLLCQLNIQERESVAENAQKKQNIATTLLRNLGAVFAGSKILVPGEGLKYDPIPLEERCNQYLTKDRGWFDNARDLRHLPIGRTTCGGVQYLIRDFRTSPLQSCVMLSGPGAKGDLPAEVRDLPVSKKAESLFFLHAFKRTRDWQRPRQGDATPPVLFKYEVHYAGGTTAEVPVRYGEGAEHWIQKSPAGLSGAIVAWAAPFPDDTSGDQAVLYQLQWNNPNPSLEIQAIDLKYDPSTNGQYGIPALMAITAATSVK
jgi:beta-galactosidase